ncbi:MAG: hypothetical protein Q7S53_05735 [bacterium]|nr:hypothetical protein [bacterium]
MAFELENKALKGIIQSDPGMFSNYSLEGSADDKFVPYAFACIYPIRTLSYVFFQVDGGEIDVAAHRKMIMEYTLRDEVFEIQKPILEVWDGLNELHTDLAVSLYAEVLDRMQLPFTFIMFARTYPKGERLAALYHPSEFPSSVCLNLLKEAVKKRDVRDN